MIEQTWKQDTQELDRSRALSLTQDQLPRDVPAILGYQIVEKLGQGQYGSVWKAVDLNARIPVAIKVFRHTAGLDYALLHGEVEKLIALCEDQRIVGLREVGWDADPKYFVMDYLESSLDKRLRDGPLSVDEAVAMFELVVSGLVHAHNKGIMHCDLKPGNILLDHDAQPRIADFGQSRLSTQHSPALGTLFYMAPEQADLKGVPDARWDVYAAGAVLYCMLTGVAPYQSDETRTQLSEADGAAAVLSRYREIIRASPKPTEHHRVPGIDRGLVEIIDRCLEKEPRRRYANAQAMREALHLRSRWLRQKPVLALGIALPLVFVILMAVGFSLVIMHARDKASNSLVETAKDSNRSFAAAVTGSVARQFDRRWRSLSSLGEKNDFREALQEWSREAAKLRAKLSERDYVKRVAELPAAKLMQERCERYLGAEYQGTRGIAWIALDSEGYEAAFAAHRDESATALIGRNLSHRDYFRGVMENSDGPDVYVSRAFNLLQESVAPDKHHVIGFSVPVFDRDATRGGPEPHVIGVLAMAVPVGEFFEFQYTNLETDEAQKRRYSDYRWIPQIATLIDTRPTEHNPETPPGQSGLVLHHAFYRLHGADWYDDKYAEYPQVTLRTEATTVLGKVVDEAKRKSREYDQRFKDAESLPNVKAVQAKKRQLGTERNTALAELYASKERELQATFADPFDYYDCCFDATGLDAWILSPRPVVVQRPGKPGLIHTELAVVVQQRRDVVVRPALDMSKRMLNWAVVLFAIAGALMLVVWFYGFTLLNPTSQSRFTRAIWRITGARTARSARSGGTGTGSGTGLSARSGAQAKTPASE